MGIEEQAELVESRTGTTVAPDNDARRAAPAGPAPRPRLAAVAAARSGPEPGEPGDGRGAGGSREGGTSLVVEEASPKVKKPPLFQVVLLNDDYTPMEFVVDVLQRIFGMDRTKATRIMLEVHTKGKGVCGVYTFEIAETKVAQVTAYARQHQHPLLCTMEEA